MIKYILHPRTVKSKTDGDIHFISAFQLAQLYKVDYMECLVWKGLETHIPENSSVTKLIHLYPKQNGDYTING